LRLSCVLRDREALEHAACSYYRFINDEYQHLIGGGKARGAIVADCSAVR
jgi:hypothetical protein